MGLKLRAALQTAGILAVITAVSLTVQLLFTILTTQQIINIIAVGSITFLVFCMYQVVLSRLEYDQKIKEISQKNG